MKKIITLLIVATGFYTAVSAQCTVTALAVQLKSVTVVGNQYIAIFDLSWQQETNNGFKFAVLHLWRTDQYPSLETNNQAYTNTSDHLDESDLFLALGNIVIEWHHTPSPFIGTTYYPHPTVPVLSSGLTISKEEIGPNLFRMTVKNITITIPDSTGTSITGDAWLSQGDHGQGVHCVSSGYSVLIGNPLISGSLDCIIPHQYDVAIKNEGTAGLNLTYNVYIDEGDAIYEPSVHDLKITTVPQGPYDIAPGATYNSGKQSYQPWSYTKPYSDHGLWIEVTAVGIPNKAIYFIPNPCFPLAVNYTSINATRTHNVVKIIWQTATEANNYGFEVQRRNGDATFQTIAFVGSKAINGNSTSALFYNYTDLNPTKNITEYRLKQIDLDKVFTLSKVVSVNGVQNSNSFGIYPNPAVANTVKIFFNDANAYFDIELIDASGKIFKKYNYIKGQNLEINKVPQGIYVIRVFERVTKHLTVQRVLVFD